jgi:hypothetical protein
MNRLTNVGITACCGGLFGFSLAPSVLAERYVLDQTPETIQRYFGKPLKVEVSNDSQRKFYTYSISKLRQVLPSLPEGATFGMTLSNNRVSDIWLFVNAISEETSASEEPESFSFGQPEAFKLYRYIFADNPPLWKEIELPFGGGGHEGFIDHKFCFGDSVVITFITYMLGQENIRIFYDPICKSDKSSADSYTNGLQARSAKFSAKSFGNYLYCS